MRSFYLSHTVAAAIHTFYITLLLELRIGVCNLMSFISEPSPAAAFLNLPRNQTSAPSAAAAAQRTPACAPLPQLGMWILHYWRLFIDFLHEFQDGKWWRKHKSLFTCLIHKGSVKHSDCVCWLYRIIIYSPRCSCIYIPVDQMQPWNGIIAA